MKQPALTPQQKRELLVGSYLDSYRRAGIPMTVDQVRRQVVDDCQLVDAAERNGELRGGPAKKDTTAPRQRPDAIAEAQRETGVRLLEGETPQLWRPRFLFRNPAKVAERWGYAVGRVKRILTDGKEGAKYVGACGPFAYEYETLWACFQARNILPAARGFQQNVFDGLSDRDAARAFMRGVEDICDRSTGVLGSWYTK